MIKAKKHLGQNFLQDPLVIEEIIAAAELSTQDTILEIGPGKGVLTEALLEQAKQVIAVELDEDLLPSLRNQFGHHENFTLIHQDALKFTPPNEPYKIVANIPYYITSPLLNHYLLEQFLLQSENARNQETKSENTKDEQTNNEKTNDKKTTKGNPPEMIVFMVQKEVAEKIIAKTGKHSVLSLQVHIFGEADLICTVPASAFEPQPKIDSAVIRIRIKKNPKLKGDLKKFFWLLHMSFKQKRKKLTNNLANAFKKTSAEIRESLEQLNINPDTRAEALTIEEWNKLFEHFSPLL